MDIAADMKIRWSCVPCQNWTASAAWIVLLQSTLNVIQKRISSDLTTVFRNLLFTSPTRPRTKNRLFSAINLCYLVIRLVWTLVFQRGDLLPSELRTIWKGGLSCSHSMQSTLNSNWTTPLVTNAMTAGSRVCHVALLCLHMYVELRPRLKLSQVTSCAYKYFTHAYQNTKVDTNRHSKIIRFMLNAPWRFHVGANDLKKLDDSLLNTGGNG